MVIDPVVTFVRFMGGSTSTDLLAGLASDSSGAVYATGTTFSVNFAPLVSPFDGTYNGQDDVFVTKFDPASGVVAYSTFIGSPTSDSAHGIDVDLQGSAYIAGSTNSSSFPTTPGAYRESLGGSTDTFICKLSPSGGSLVYSTFFGGLSSETPFGIAVDGEGQTVVAGQTDSTNLDTLPGAFDTSLGGNSDGFVARFNSSGSALVQATYLGGSGSEGAIGGIDLTSTGDVLVAGHTGSSDFPTTAGAYDQVYNGGFEDGFVTRLSSALAMTTYSTFLGTAVSDTCLA